MLDHPVVLVVPPGRGAQGVRAHLAVRVVKSDRDVRVAMADPEARVVIPELVGKADRVALVGIQDPDSPSVQSCSSSFHSHLISILEAKKRYALKLSCTSSDHFNNVQ